MFTVTISPIFQETVCLRSPLPSWSWPGLPSCDRPHWGSLLHALTFLIFTFHVASFGSEHTLEHTHARPTLRSFKPILCFHSSRRSLCHVDGKDSHLSQKEICEGVFPKRGAGRQLSLRAVAYRRTG